MYEFKSRVRYSETDPDALLSYIAIMNYMQDCSIFHSEDCGQGILRLEAEHRVWLLTYWDIVIERRPALAEEISISTWPYDFRDMFGYRNFLIKDIDDMPLVKADSYWILTDTLTGSPIRVTDEYALPYGPKGERLDIEKKNRKIALPRDMATAETVMVKRDQIDTNMHVNNAKYVDMAREVLPESAAGAGIKEIRAEYKKAAVLGDELVIKLGRRENAYVVSLQNPQGEVFSNVELTLTRP